MHNFTKSLTNKNSHGISCTSNIISIYLIIFIIFIYYIYLCNYLIMKSYIAITYLQIPVIFGASFNYIQFTFTTFFSFSSIYFNYLILVQFENFYVFRRSYKSLICMYIRVSQHSIICFCKLK